MRPSWRTWKTPDILRVMAIEERLWAKREQALCENDIEKAYRYTERFMAVSARGDGTAMAGTSAAR
jgi:hypothetical protein